MTFSYFSRSRFTIIKYYREFRYNTILHYRSNNIISKTIQILER